MAYIRELKTLDLTGVSDEATFTAIRWSASSQERLLVVGILGHQILAHLFWYKLKYCKNIDAYYFFCK